MYKNRYLILLCYFGLLLCITTLGLSTYAYLRSDEEEIVNPIENKTVNELIDVNYIDTSNVVLLNAKKGDKITKSFTIENKSNSVVYYNIKLDNVINNYNEELVFELYSNNGSVVSEKVVPNSSSNIIELGFIDGHDIQNYDLVIKLLGEIEDSDVKTFSSNIVVDEVKNNIENGSIYEYIVSQVSGTINTNEYKKNVDGVYFTNNSINGNTIYFYRGSNKLNNNVIFADSCYKILRTSEDNGVKLVYNGEYNNGVCSSALIEQNISYNDYSNYNAYVGYMYGNVSSDNYVSEHKNTNNSTLKGTSDVWFNNSLKEYSNYIDNSGIYCNDRSMINFKYKGVSYGELGFSNNNTGYRLMNDYYINNKILSYDCNINDRFSVDNSDGNNSLSYSVGSISIDELYYAGYTVNEIKYKKVKKGKKTKLVEVTNKVNKDNFLYTDSSYWTMSPAYYNGQDAYIFVVDKNRVVTKKASDQYGIRPVITIKGNTKILDGDGSVKSPFILTEIKEKSEEE